jgi:hypothetical protein
VFVVDEQDNMMLEKRTSVIATRVNTFFIFKPPKRFLTQMMASLIAYVMLLYKTGTAELETGIPLLPVMVECPLPK